MPDPGTAEPRHGDHPRDSYLYDGCPGCEPLRAANERTIRDRDEAVRLGKQDRYLDAIARARAEGATEARRELLAKVEALPLRQADVRKYRAAVLRLIEEGVALAALDDLGRQRKLSPMVDPGYGGPSR